MIRFLQTPGPLKKIILGGLLLIICAAMVITLVPGGIGSSLGLTGPGKGIVATVGDEDIIRRTCSERPAVCWNSKFLTRRRKRLCFFRISRARLPSNSSTIKPCSWRLAALACASPMKRCATKSSTARSMPQPSFPGGNFVGQDQYEECYANTTLPSPCLSRMLRTRFSSTSFVT